MRPQFFYENDDYHITIDIFDEITIEFLKDPYDVRVWSGTLSELLDITKTISDFIERINYHEKKIELQAKYFKDCIDKDMEKLHKKKE